MLSALSSLGPNDKLRYDFTQLQSGKPVSLMGLLTEQWVRVCVQECRCSPKKPHWKVFIEAWVVTSPQLYQMVREPLPGLFTLSPNPLL